VSEIPSAEQYFKHDHCAVEVDSARVAALREALEAAAIFGQLDGLETFLATHAQGGPIDWFERTPGFSERPPGRLLELCHADGARQDGLGASGSLIRRFLTRGEALLPPAERGRFYGWADAGLDAWFDVRLLSAQSALHHLRQDFEYLEWFGEVHDWLAEVNPPEQVQELTRATLSRWRRIYKERAAAYAEWLTPLADREALLFSWFEERLDR
jgi:hypothetical protein